MTYLDPKTTKSPLSFMSQKNREYASPTRPPFLSKFDFSKLTNSESYKKKIDFIEHKLTQGVDDTVSSFEFLTKTEYDCYHLLEFLLHEASKQPQTIKSCNANLALAESLKKWPLDHKKGQQILAMLVDIAERMLQTKIDNTPEHQSILDVLQNSDLLCIQLVRHLGKLNVKSSKQHLEIQKFLQNFKCPEYDIQNPQQGFIDTLSRRGKLPERRQSIHSNEYVKSGSSDLTSTDVDDEQLDNKNLSDSDSSDETGFPDTITSINNNSENQNNNSINFMEHESIFQLHLYDRLQLDNTFNLRDNMQSLQDILTKNYLFRLQFDGQLMLETYIIFITRELERVFDMNNIDSTDLGTLIGRVRISLADITEQRAAFHASRQQEVLNRKRLD